MPKHGTRKRRQSSSSRSGDSSSEVARRRQTRRAKSPSSSNSASSSTSSSHKTATKKKKESRKRTVSGSSDERRKEDTKLTIGHRQCQEENESMSLDKTPNGHQKDIPNGRVNLESIANPGKPDEKLAIAGDQHDKGMVAEKRTGFAEECRKLAELEKARQKAEKKARKREKLAASGEQPPQKPADNAEKQQNAAATPVEANACVEEDKKEKKSKKQSKHEKAEPTEDQDEILNGKKEKKLKKQRKTQGHEAVEMRAETPHVPPECEEHGPAGKEEKKQPKPDERSNSEEPSSHGREERRSKKKRKRTKEDRNGRKEPSPDPSKEKRVLKKEKRSKSEEKSDRAEPSRDREEKRVKQSEKRSKSADTSDHQEKLAKKQKKRAKSEEGSLDVEEKKRNKKSNKKRSKSEERNPDARAKKSSKKREKRSKSDSPSDREEQSSDARDEKSSKKHKKRSKSDDRSNRGELPSKKSSKRSKSNGKGRSKSGDTSGHEDRSPKRGIAKRGKKQSRRSRSSSTSRSREESRNDKKKANKDKQRSNSSSSSSRSQRERRTRKSAYKAALSAFDEPLKPPGKAGAAIQLAGLGDLAALQKQLQEERSLLQMFVIRAKHDHEEKVETADRIERREKEYYRASFGEPCGPGSRFLLEEELGTGAFSTVFRGRDTLGSGGNQGKEYAIKFIRKNAMLRKACEKEVKFMRILRLEASEKDPEGARCLLGLASVETFEHDGHWAMVFPLQRCDLRRGLAKYGGGGGLPLSLVRSYAGNIFLALRALRKVDVIHSDVKPDNLLMSLDKASVKLSDFGCAMRMTERIRTEEIQPRCYRAPEVILGQSYSTQIDMWSVGTTLFELATGRVLFRGRTPNGVLHEILHLSGGFYKKFAIKGEFAPKHFTREGSFRLREPAVEAVGVGPITAAAKAAAAAAAVAVGGAVASAEALFPMAMFPKPAKPGRPVILQKLLEECNVAPPQGADVSAHKASLRLFAELITTLLVPDPAERATPELCLKHRFFASSRSLTLALPAPTVLSST